MSLIDPQNNVDYPEIPGDVKGNVPPLITRRDIVPNVPDRSSEQRGLYPGIPRTLRTNIPPLITGRDIVLNVPDRSSEQRGLYPEIPGDVKGNVPPLIIGRDIVPMSLIDPRNNVDSTRKFQRR